MGSLDDPKLRDLHDQVQRALTWSTPPNFQRVCELLNGMSMADILDELYRIQGAGYLENLGRFAIRAQNVNVPRLRAAIGVFQDVPPQDLDALINALPADQQRSIRSVQASRQPARNLNPLLFPDLYSNIRLLPTTLPLPGSQGAQPRPAPGTPEAEAARLAADVVSGITANAPNGVNPTTYTVTLLYRNFNAQRFGSDSVNLSLLREPGVSVQLSPDPNNPFVVSAALALFNFQLKRNIGLIRRDIEFNLSGGVGAQGPAPQVNGTVQAQVELHVTTTLGITAGTSLTVGPPRRPGDPPDYGSIQTGNSSVGFSFTPFTLGIVGHWDAPAR